MTTASEERQKEEAVALEPDSRTLRRQARTCASSVPSAASTSLRAVTQRGGVSRRALVRAADFLDRPGSLVHAQPPTFAQAREQHHDRASRWNAPLLRCLRLTWGYTHLLLIKPVLNGLEWVTETPLRFTAALALAFIVWFWS